MARIVGVCVHIDSTDGDHSVIFCQEPLPGDSANQGFSVTVDGGDECWGEFFSKEDAALLWWWLGKRLQEIV